MHSKDNNVAKNPSDDDVVQTLQKKIAQLESIQRRLEQELSNKKSAPAVTASPRTVSPPDPKSESIWSYQLLIGALAGVLIVVFLSRRRSSGSSPQPAKEGEAAFVPPTAAAPQVVTPVTPPPAESAVMPAATISIQAPTVPVSQGSSRGGAGIAVAIGGMAAVVFLVAFVVQQISSFAGVLRSESVERV